MVREICHFLKCQGKVREFSKSGPRVCNFVVQCGCVSLKLSKYSSAIKVYYNFNVNLVNIIIAEGSKIVIATMSKLMRVGIVFFNISLVLG